MRGPNHSLTDTDLGFLEAVDGRSRIDFYLLVKMERWLPEAEGAMDVTLATAVGAAEGKSSV